MQPAFVNKFLKKSIKKTVKRKRKIFDDYYT